MAELAYAHGLGPCAVRLVGSNPTRGTKIRKGGPMKTSLDKTKKTRHKISVEVPKERVKKSVETALKTIQKDAQIKGFRKGEVPLDVLHKYMGKEADKEIIKQIVRDTYAEAIRQERSAPISEPYIDYDKYEKDKDFNYTASFDVMPEIEAPQYEGLKLEKEKVEVKEEEVEMELKRLQRAMTQLEPADDANLGPGFVGLIDFKGTVDGKPFKGSEAENFVADFGSMLPAFEEKIAGMKKNEVRDVSFNYPSNYFNKEIAGKTGQFKVTLKEIRKKNIPDINDDFAKSLGKQNLGEVKQEIEKQIINFKEEFWKRRLGEMAIRQLAEKNAIEVPEIMVSNEIGAMLEEVARQLKMRGQTIEDAGIEAKAFVRTNHEEATKRVRGYLIAFAISKQANVEATDEDLENRINQIAKQTNQPVDKVKSHFAKENFTDRLKSQILYEKTLDLIVSKAKVKEIKPKKHKKDEKTKN